MDIRDLNDATAAEAFLRSRLSAVEHQISDLEQQLTTAAPGRDTNRILMQLKFRSEDRERLTKAIAGK
ncbi:hypothetical protein [Xanthobacter oligotrophicus]|uniref:hypothetical protein n=1 Tax=Xanthobacter oligotrophicus TaxID=2607286 RepID=UPI0011F271B1|nr:hypothetical protein [Xanthobacter oligotrophicus]MCG5237110.1 hypothetical protein [Xanthobacter oligotrophicus]